MDEDIIVVTMNYRLSSLGFLNTGDDLIRGNMGFKDQSMVLRFCQENIRRFGGDPDRITLMGEDSGAVAVHFHILSPLSKGLFSKAILQSGTAAMPGAFITDPKSQSKRFGKRVGCLTKNTTALVMCLKRKRAKVLILPSSDVMSPIHDPQDVFAGTLEAVRREDTFLSEHPMTILEQGNFNAVPVIMGVTSAEGCLKTARIAAYPEVQENMGYHWKDWAPRFLNYDPENTDISERIRQYYFGEGRTANPGDDLESLTQMFSDGLYYHSLKYSAVRHARFAPVYLYFYTYESKALPNTYSLVRAVRPDDWTPSEVQVATSVTHDMMKKRSRSTGAHEWGVCHGEDELVLWHFNWMSEIWKTSPDYRFSRLLLTTFVEFAEKDGYRMKFEGIPWPAIDPKEEPLPYMQFDEPARIIDEPFTKYLSFWDDLEVRNPNATEDDYF
ncbi:unnamed protein product [Orchesella dallaii]